MLKKGKPIKCRISSTNEATFQIIRRWCRKHKLIRDTNEQALVLHVSISRKHQGLLNSMRSYNGVTVRVITELPQHVNAGKRSPKGEGVKTERPERVFSRRQKEVKNRKRHNRSSFAPSKTSICGIPIHEIQEWAHFLSKGEFLALHNLTHEEFNSAVLALDVDVHISFTYTCREKGCEQVFGGDDSLAAFRKHLLQTRHRKGGE